MTDRDATVEIRGETVVLMGERAVFWQRTGTLLVADPHFGKAAAFRAAGVPVPRGTTTETLQRLDAAMHRTGAQRVIFLGDFLHAREGRAPETLRAINEWRATRADVEMVLVRGNHDKKSGDPPQELNIGCVEGPLRDAPFEFAHHPSVSNDGYVLCGHIHPGVRLTGPGRERSRLPCFWFGERTAVLPAFGEFTGLSDIKPISGDGVWVVADSAVVQAHAP
jgi:DNA ligase-associated metallophosphoesterase